MELYIYDRAAGMVDILEDATSIRWRRRYYEPGEVEIHAPATMANMALLTEGRIIRRTDRVEAAIIEGVQIDGDDLSVTGRMLSAVLDRAILSKRYRLKSTAEAAMLALIPEGTRVIPELKAGESAGLGGGDVDIQATYKNLLTVEERISRASGLGFRVLYEDGSLVFEVYSGVDHTVLQADRPHVIFSDEFGNLVDPQYTLTTADYRNKAYVAGAGEGDARIVEIVDQSDGGEVRELYVDARDLQKDADTSDEDYRSILRQRGLEKLAEQVRIESFEAAGVNVPNFTYGTDWDLGDLVTVYYSRLGIVMHERVTEVEEVYEGGVARVYPTFGSPLPEKLDLGDDTE